MLAKRAFDLLFAGSVILLLFPWLLVLAIAVKLDSDGPVLFRQVRVGRFGRQFRILKFRTMLDSSGSGGPQITVGADPRITRVGAFLRKYKLDELPQFINVLLGDMSVVGPRPEVPRYVALYPEALREVVLSVRPGITDLASINFHAESALLAQCRDPEATYVNEVMPAKLEYCKRYVANRSFVGDLRIIARTLTKIFRRR